MKIIKYKKIGKSIYRVFLENDYLDLREEVILKYEILLLKDIDLSLIKKLKEENNFFDGYNLAIKYISKKMRTINEVEKYLAENEISNIDKIINLLIKNKYLNDEYYVECYIKDRINLSNDGPIKVRNMLINMGVKPNIIDDKIVNYSYDIEVSKVKDLALKKIKKNSNKSKYFLKMKIHNELFNMGFNKEIISLVLDEMNFYNEEVYAKQKEKIYNKLAKKYSGTELESRYNNELYRLGFKD